MTGTLAFTDSDVSDTPTASIDTAHQTVVFTDANGTDLTSTLTTPEITAFESAFTLPAVSGNTNNGSLDWTYSIQDNALDFLTQGQTVTVTTPVLIDDLHGDQVQTNVVVTLTGNDAPVFTLVPSTPAPVVEAGVDAGGNPIGTPSSTVTLTATEQDVGGVTYDLTGWTQVDPINDPSDYTKAGGFGTFTLNTTSGTLTYLLDDDNSFINGLQSSDATGELINITATNSEGASATTTVNFQIQGSNDAPVANDDAFSTSEGTPVIFDVLANDTDVDSAHADLTAVVVTGPGYGSLQANSDGTFTYRPNANFSGTDSFTYNAFDGSVDSNTATVTLNVSEPAGVDHTMTLTSTTISDQSGNDYADDVLFANNKVYVITDVYNPESPTEPTTNVTAFDAPVNVNGPRHST